jgi:hypothetical protein
MSGKRHEQGFFLWAGDRGMRRERTPPRDEEKVACPKLGHLVPFSYCSRENDGMPCFKAIDCWYDRFLVEDYFREILEPEEWKAVFDRPPKDRMSRLLEIVDETRKGT